MKAKICLIMMMLLFDSGAMAEEVSKNYGCGSVEEWNRTGHLIALPGCLRGSPNSEIQNLKRILISIGTLAPSVASSEEQEQGMTELNLVCPNISNMKWENEVDREAYIKACRTLKGKLRGSGAFLPETEEERIKLHLIVRKNALSAVGVYKILDFCKNLIKGTQTILKREKDRKGIEILKKTQAVLQTCDKRQRELEAERKTLEAACLTTLAPNCLERIDFFLIDIEEVKKYSRDVIGPLVNEYYRGESHSPL